MAVRFGRTDSYIALTGMAAPGTVETLAATYRRRDDHAGEVASALLAGAGSAAGVVPEAAVPVTAGSARLLRPWWRRDVGAIDEIARRARRSMLT